MPLYKWSQTAGSNAGADPTINYNEGQAPSSLNDSARAVMAAVAMYRDDIAGAIVTGGSSTAYTVASYSGFDTLAHMSGQMIAFSPHTTNGATVLLNVDGLGQKPLRSSPGVELLSGTIIQGTPYVAIYNNTDGAFYLQGFYGNPYNIPLGAGLDYWGSTAPNTSFALPFGQALSRTTYASLFGLFGTAYGSGDGSTTFNIPDKRGRVSAGADNIGGTFANRLSTASGMNTGGIGGVGGTETHALTTAELAVHSHGVVDTGHGHPGSTGNLQGTVAGGNSPTTALNGETNTGVSAGQVLNIATSGTGISIANAGSGTAHPIVQPTIVCNYIMRII